jgi:hypothetical protein
MIPSYRFGRGPANIDEISSALDQAAVVLNLIEASASDLGCLLCDDKLEHAARLARRRLDDARRAAAALWSQLRASGARPGDRVQ